MQKLISFKNYFLEFTFSHLDDKFLSTVEGHPYRGHLRAIDVDTTLLDHPLALGWEVLSDTAILFLIIYYSLGFCGYAVSPSFFSKVEGLVGPADKPLCLFAWLITCHSY